MSRKRLVIIDGYSLLFRAFYGTRYLSTSEGRPTNALFGFTSMLLQLFQDVRPDALVVALDAPGKTFRHADYAEYKGTRRETPEELISQLDFSRELISDLNIPVIEAVGFEADDVTGTISRMGEENGYETTIVTGDLDALQLVDDWVKVMTTRKGVTDVVIYGPDEVRERYGFGPEYVPDYKALVGDSSDNIPGCPGIGEKTATILIQRYGSIENIIEKLPEIEEKYRKKLEPGVEQMKKSKWLATIVRDAPVTFDFSPYHLTADHVTKAKEALLSLEFRSQVRRFEQVLAPYLASGTTMSGVEEVREAIEATEKKVTSQKELMDWVGDNPYAIVVEQATNPSLFGDVESFATVAVGSVAARVPVGLMTELFVAKPGQAVAFDSKSLTHRVEGKVTEHARFDVTLAAYVLQSNRSNYDLGDLVQGYLDLAPPATDGQKAVALLELEREMRDKLEKEGQTFVFQEMELPLVPILVDMEREGIGLSSEELREFSKSLAVEIDKIQTKVHELAGEVFNIGSPKQIGEILFEKMGIPGSKKTKTGYATGAEILQELAPTYEIAGEILNYRELTKLKSTYADALPKLAVDGRIHTSFNQTVAATGRLSSNEPNLQNIPIRTELGRQIRRAFVARPGTVFGSFDYSQIELRILAHMCHDENLVEAFQKRVDVHTVTAALMFHIEQDAVTKEQRRLAKMLNYAVLYGVTDFGLANQLGAGFSVKEAGELIKQYNLRFPKVKAFTEATVEEARGKGFTVTLRGRRRSFADIHAGNRSARLYAERQAINAPIQGTAADMIKLAMIEVWQKLRGSQSKMLLQVHDELLFEMGSDRETWIEPLRTAMETALPLSVPVEVDAKVGGNWLEMKVV